MTDGDVLGDRTLGPGTRVEVRDGYQGHWHKGYLVVDGDDEAGYLVRRAAEEEPLPRPLPRSSVRRERRNSMWWM